jgi:hypothetical protein
VDEPSGKFRGDTWIASLIWTPDRNQRFSVSASTAPFQASLFYHTMRGNQGRIWLSRTSPPLEKAAKV